MSTNYCRSMTISSIATTCYARIILLVTSKPRHQSQILETLLVIQDRRKCTVLQVSVEELQSQFVHKDVHSAWVT
jgi:hypothetical protein